MQFKPKLVVLLTTLVATVGACSGGESPEIEPISDQIAQVGVEMSIPIVATDADGDSLTYDFNAEIPDLGERAAITQTPSGTGVFRWTPLTSDVGVWPIDFVVDDGGNSVVVTIQIDVRSAVGEQSVPVFRKPLGTGSTLNMTQRQCIQVDIEVEDRDTSTVMLAQEEPRIPGATIRATGGLTGVWEWCPSTQQLESGEERFRLVLSADDLTNPKTIKNYLVVIRQDSKPGCPLEAPVIEHTPSDQSSLVGLTITAEISDDVGLKHDPLLYYSLDDVGPDPDLGRLTQVSMSLVSGDTTRGTWSAEIPNPVADGNAGDSAQISYIIVANDDDDDQGTDCDHLTQVPLTGAFQMTVTNPGGAGGAEVCEACTADIQCGDSDDLCVRVGVAAETFCLQGCSTDAECPADFVCSPDPIDSIGGASGRQCVPVSNDCADPGGTICVDDSFEDNDNQAEAEANPALAPGSYEMVSCPIAAINADDEDWYRIDIAEDSQVEVTLEATTTADLDIYLYDSASTIVARSISSTSSEAIVADVTAGTYFIRMNSIDTKAVETTYTLAYTVNAGGFAPTCEDDASEPDNSIGEARITDIVPNPYLANGTICADNDDWYRVLLFTGETLYVDLTFDDSAGDLDLYFHDAVGTNLTPCCSSPGQTATDNEHAEYTIGPGCEFPVLCEFFVRVNGYNGAENNYDLRIALEP